MEKGPSDGTLLKFEKPRSSGAFAFLVALGSFPGAGPEKAENACEASPGAR
jgi:hypothetical protein